MNWIFRRKLPVVNRHRHCAATDNVYTPARVWGEDGGPPPARMSPEFAGIFFNHTQLGSDIHIRNIGSRSTQAVMSVKASRPERDSRPLTRILLRIGSLQRMGSPQCSAVLLGLSGAVLLSSGSAGHTPAFCVRLQFACPPSDSLAFLLQSKYMQVKVNLVLLNYTYGWVYAQWRTGILSPAFALSLLRGCPGSLWPRFG